MAPSNRNTNRRGFGAALKRGWNSKAAGIAAIVVIVLVVIVVLISTLLGVFAPANNDDGGTASKPAPTSSTSAAADGPCNVKVTDTSSTPRVPSDLTWKTGAAGLTWPVSKSVGPTKTIDGFDACFDRSPLGAALAAQTATYSQYDGKHSVSSALGFYIADSAGKQKSIATSEKQPGAADTRAAGINPAGFTVDAFTKDRAEVTLVYSYPSSSTGYIGMPTSLVWTDDDWKISVLDNGELFTGNLTNPSENDFIPWTGADQ
ncbi:hypothetical protein ITJ58_18100 [Curtobacterium flaccumfaciens]|uniref:hypothetical protein n=1 Tax=Curtobacterium flaccumfaciens TaxID=2035 RepID=UPI00188BD9AC|nr:hypothetical protein [Curtobacterium flaccumfaciens]MBF4595678.1 hypothetical protein [Curtobacterium flaccumfaciens]